MEIKYRARKCPKCTGHQFNPKSHQVETLYRPRLSYNKKRGGWVCPKHGLIKPDDFGYPKFDTSVKGHRSGAKSRVRW